jgi:hypothetical protein
MIGGLMIGGFTIGHGMRLWKTLSGTSLAAFLMLGAVACGGSSAGGGDSGALDPSGATPGASAAGGAASPVATTAGVGGVGAGAGGAGGLRSFAFPAGVQVQFQTPLPASGPQRAAMIGYENYVDSLWYAVASRGSHTQYRQYMSGNALTFADSLIREFKTGDYKLSGTVVYFDISVPQVFYGDGAVVQSCVDASGLRMVNAATGKTAGTVFNSSFQHYQEQAADGKSKAGHWTVSHTENLSASSGASAGVCV